MGIGIQWEYRHCKGNSIGDGNPSKNTRHTGFHDTTGVAVLTVTVTVTVAVGLLGL